MARQRDGTLISSTPTDRVVRAGEDTRERADAANVAQQLKDQGSLLATSARD